MSLVTNKGGEGPGGGEQPPLPTPSPLRRMEDPTAYHVMPSRKKAKSIMPPPPPKPRSKRPAALDEDTFVAAMGEIIERDFFPDLPKLQRQLKWLEGVEKRRVHTLSEIRRIVVSEQRRFDQPGGATPLAGATTPMARASTSASTPLFAGNATPGPGGSSASSVAGSAVGEAQALPLSLDQFLSRFQSEDDASFGALAEKMREAHRRKYWWVYEHPTIEAGSGERPLYLLPSGEFMTPEERKKREEATDAKPKRGDDRPGVVDTWTYRPKNSLIFQPELEESAKVHKVANAPPLLLEGGAAPGGGAMVAYNARVGEAAKAPKEVVHCNTRFSSDYKHGLMTKPSPVERLTSGLSTISTDTGGSAAEAATEGFVPMTPMLIPGAGGVSPPMTWGEVEGTPMRVVEPFEEAEEMARSRRFRIQEPTYREKAAAALDDQQRKKKGSGAARKVYSGGDSGRKTPTPLFPSSSRKRTLAELTPAAQSLAARLVGQQAAKVGASSEFGAGGALALRASYGGTPLKRPGSRPATGTLPAKGGGLPTPSPSPLVSHRRAEGPQGGGAKAVAQSKRASLTDNLLDI